MRYGLLVTVGLTALSACSSNRTPAPLPTPAPGGVVANGIVERVVDGDTVVVRFDGAEERVRLIGIDTPESVKPDSPVECFGKEAADFTSSLLPADTPVRVERDVEARDDYGRLLGYVIRADDALFVNVEVVRQGYAQPLTIPPNVAHVDEFVQAARDAEAADRGLWSACAAG
ncbi:MAG: thermonuclease family protein [Acidimicrobiia bacterium]